MDTDRFIIYVETEDFYNDISNDVDKWFDTRNFSKDINRPLEKVKNIEVIGKFKDELGGLIMSEFCAHRPKTYVFLSDGINDYEKHGIINKRLKVRRNVWRKTRSPLMTMLMCFLIKLSWSNHNLALEVQLMI